jgi:hypothetical protein
MRLEMMRRGRRLENRGRYKMLRRGMIRVLSMRVRDTL